ncbi:hypothetical protein EA456_03680 [Streptococcus dysgalactiae subsp. dysgalactiae]|nr:hypothetical protein WH81_00845 [Streptococcus dysgalactiae subsp. equisimilis]QFZ09168.1 hypothetical protein EBL83_02365 [Streptococcus dysgalactiae]QGG99662.1 hypothetical protein EA456_03680 [Streptococcus dysgalactiae subsp. dysgalactiae]KKC20272.1 hypothetical protein WH14_02025 [Streptococcus dysgalactiae subsp. equisimilis]KKC23595.1 hypothetical protein WH79_00225 [Streptococcus dysgalactiae subsp. equisimilis]
MFYQKEAFTTFNLTTMPKMLYLKCQNLYLTFNLLGGHLMKLNRLFILGCLSASTLALGNLSSTSVHADTWQSLTSQLQEVTPGKNAQNEDPSL